MDRLIDIRQWVNRLVLALAVGLVLAGAHPARAETSFVAVAFHEVVDSESDLDEDAVTVDRLIQFFEFLLSDGWTVLSLDDIAQARDGQSALPEKSILLTFDDGYADLYTRVFPLIQAYQFPIVSALVGQWMDAPMSAQVNYGGQMVPRSNFLSWDQAREMQASGLVEFASHSYDQHFALRADVHGTQVPAMVTYAFEGQANQYQDSATFDKRIRRDMVANNQLFTRELGKAPRAFVWPYGRYSLKTVEIAKSLGYDFALNLNDEPSRATWPMEIARYLPERNPTLGAMLEDLRHEPGFVAARRVMTFDVETIWSNDLGVFDQRLGAFVEDVRNMAPTDVAFKPYRIQADGSLKSWFYRPSHTGSVDSPATRLTWQLESRADVGVMAQVSLSALSNTLGSRQAVLNWFAELGQRVPVTGIIFEDADDWIGQFNIADLTARAVVPGAIKGPWDIRQQRRALNPAEFSGDARLALEAFRAVEQFRPTIDWAVIVDERQAPSAESGAASCVVSDDTSGAPCAAAATQPPAVSPVIDLMLVRPAAALPLWADQVLAEGVAGLLPHRRLGVWLGELNGGSAKQMADNGGAFVAQGGSVLGWHIVIDEHIDDAIEPSRATLSASTFPVRY